MVCLQSIKNCKLCPYTFCKLCYYTIQFYPARKRRACGRGIGGAQGPRPTGVLSADGSEGPLPPAGRVNPGTIGRGIGRWTLDGWPRFYEIPQNMIRALSGVGGGKAPSGAGTLTFRYVMFCFIPLRPVPFRPVPFRPVPLRYV